MNKGDIVNCSATVFTDYLDNVRVESVLLHEPRGDGKLAKRCLYKSQFEKPIEVLLLGKTTIQTGIRRESWQGQEDYEPPYLDADKHHSVWVVCWYSSRDNRYYKPAYALETDLQILDRMSNDLPFM